MKKISLLISIFLFSLVSFSQNTDSAWLVNNYVKLEKYITMRDGVRLFTSVYIPKNKSEKHPILMTRTPYSCAPYGENKWIDFWNSYELAYFKEGYIIAVSYTHLTLPTKRI